MSDLHSYGKLRTFLSLVISFSLILASLRISSSALADGEVGDWLQVSYGPRSEQALAVTFSSATRLADGSVIADLVITNKRGNVYDLTFEQLDGTVTKSIGSGGNFFDVSYFPLMGKSTLSISRASFSPNSRLKMKFSKWGYVASDTTCNATLDLATSAVLFSLGVYPPVSAEGKGELIRAAAVEFVSDVENSFFDLGSMLAKLRAEEYWEAFVEICEGIVHTIDGPEKLQQFIAYSLGQQISQNTITGFVTSISRATRMLPLVTLIWDLLNAPNDVEVNVSNIAQSPAPAAPILTTPDNASLTSSLRPSFNWLSPDGASAYVFELSSSSDLSSPLLRQETRSNAYSLPSDLAPDSVFYWRVTALGTSGSSNPSSVWSFQTPTSNPSPVPGIHDRASFVSDVTIPDGTIVSPGQTFTKVWRVRNSGTSTWEGFRLLFTSGDALGGNAVNIPTTAPGQEVNISVALTAPSDAGSKVGVWQIVNRDGVHVPGGMVTVVVEVAGQVAGGHIRELRADPGSPSNANTVRVVARVNWWAQYRAMRLLADGQVIGETAATENTFDWNAGAASRGDHTLTLEVADQSDTSWSRPERRVLAYWLEGEPAPVNHAPNRPTLSSPHDWTVYYTGNTANLCAQANGDPDGDAITGYYFDVNGAETWNSGWVGGNCATTRNLGAYSYEWRVKVRDSRGAESEWSEPWHFTLVRHEIIFTDMHFEPQDPQSEQVKVRVCTDGYGGVGITIRVSVNTACDGSDSGEWRGIGELGVPCFNETDAPNWGTLDFGDGSHRVRAEAHGPDSSWERCSVREEVYALPHRRPGYPARLAPMPASGNQNEPTYLNSRTVTFRWAEPLRATGYRLFVGQNPDPTISSIVYRELGGGVTSYTYTFDQDYPALYWMISAINDLGTHNGTTQYWGLDRVAPSSAVQALAPTMTTPTFTVTWTGEDALSGVRSCDVQFCEPGRTEWADWLVGQPTAKTREEFTGQPGHSYAFRCRAWDQAGNTDGYPVEADATTYIDQSEVSQADLSVHSFATYPNPGGGLLVQAVVANEGNDSTRNGFYVDLYKDHQPSSPSDDMGRVHSWATEPLGAGQIVTFTIALDTEQLDSALTGVEMNESQATLYLIVDAEGVVTDEPVAPVSVPVCMSAPDGYENDDTASAAKALTSGPNQSRNFTAGDRDWVIFTARAGKVYTLRTSDLGPNADTCLYLYDTDATTLLAANDDQVDSLASQIEWIAPVAGNYYALVRPWQPDAGGCGHDYVLSLAENEPVTPTPTPSPTATPTPSATPTALPPLFVWQAEAEQGSIVAPLVTGLEANASDCGYVFSPVQEYQSPGVGSATYGFTVPAAGRYYVWVRVMGFDLWSNSYFVSLDEGTPIHYEYCDEAHTNPKWVWDSVDELAPHTQLAAGAHTLTFRGREKQARLDRIVIVNRPDYTPSEVATCETPIPYSPPLWLSLLRK